LCLFELGSAEQIYPQYIEHLDAALENFCDRHWPCEFKASGGQCVNVRSGHGSKGHQLKSGKVLAVGEYESSFCFQWHQWRFRYDVYYRLDGLLRMLHNRITERQESEESAAAAIHREFVLRNFYRHTCNAAAVADSQPFICHSACFSCLFNPPEHPLPCGHVYVPHVLKHSALNDRHEEI
jgi:hypothetical protein